MHPIDLSIFIIYVIGLLAFGYFFFQRNKGGDDYYVGGRNMNSFHIGLSVVATDVGGGFSIGLGGLGFVMGLSGSWMLFTGLIGAWLAAVFLIPKVKQNPAFDNAYTFPQIFGHYYSANVAFVAAIISAIGYAGFTSSQMLAGAKLASGTFADLELQTALYIMGVVAVVYTVMGGLKAVIYTDTIQWTLLMFGLIFVGVPIAYIEIGGMEAIRATVDPAMLTLTNIGWQDLVYWAVTIVPIWFVGMTLYQRIYACRDEKTAKKAWYVAGLFEWPVMAFLGVLLGLFARVAADQGMFAYLGAADISATDPETGLPMLLRTVLPVGFLGIMMAAYFSAILSTADSCLMASSGNVVTDLIGRFKEFNSDSSRFVRLSQITTLIIGTFALLLASTMENVLDLMLDSYAFMVSGLFVPVIGALYWSRSTPAGAMAAMILGGSTTITLRYSGIELPYDLDPNVFGITMSAIAFICVSLLTKQQKN
ncbi:sodium:solute symporter family protein [Rhodohalobacter sp. SW132]|uniref:sodium:solute symporter family protein n=1 Tax=Rhodohalobacter sp. SW132 TaxID=2293433 RepID=UPI000E265ACE|nr:sodium:solute symporter family protein [Rhodohalobacter sp. SW132]REL29114.1 sodium:solute symporter family protein [Rhodohalobacter sp. SW132]